jgi:hypothetical protein
MRMITSTSEKGRELAEILIRELNIPPHTRWFTVRFGVDEVVTVTCEFAAETREETK